ncbi:hypothetical protein ES707_07121 [subsurface metagenome]
MQKQFYAFAFLLIGMGVGLVVEELSPCVYVGVGVLGIGFSFLIFLIVSGIVLGKPKIHIELRKLPRFQRSRTILELQISNRRLGRLWRHMCTREPIYCSVEANFIVGDEIPSLNNSAAIAEWWNKLPHELIKADSELHRIELISKKNDEKGFHIKRLKPETLMIAEDVLVVILIKSGIEIVKKATWVIFDEGTKGWDLDFEYLGC